MAKSDGCDYFKRASLFWIVVVTVSMGFFTCTVFVPEKVPFAQLGAFGSFCKHLAENHAGFMFKGWCAAWAVHAFEAFIAMRMCREKGITNSTTRCLWFVQTLLYGFASLGLLLKYKPVHPKQR
ncbi:transmembrane protein 254 [Solea senegalensis]|uniref:Transmembrane protein 254 n=1 Tax=Solea senegalensis TaxID=28829 RepID=A0AAV6S585_SOLSE|nr:transmembrane protein 254 [Solea senegalensis]KAG7512920.1 transmembrane protein 254 [Solea senegalensis]